MVSADWVHEQHLGLALLAGHHPFVVEHVGADK